MEPRTVCLPSQRLARKQAGQSDAAETAARSLEQLAARKLRRTQPAAAMRLSMMTCHFSFALSPDT
jgi:hypothetical protein